MNLMVIEVLLWIGFGLILWAMRDSLMQLESELRAHSAARRPPIVAHRPCVPQQLIAPIGQYSGRPIHDYALIDGRHYRFSYVCPADIATRLACNERWLAPGLIYTECPQPAGTPETAGSAAAKSRQNDAGQHDDH